MRDSFTLAEIKAVYDALAALQTATKPDSYSKLKKAQLQDARYSYSDDNGSISFVVTCEEGETTPILRVKISDGSIDASKEALVELSR